MLGVVVVIRKNHKAQKLFNKKFSLKKIIMWTVKTGESNRRIEDVNAINIAWITFNKTKRKKNE